MKNLLSLITILLLTSTTTVLAQNVVLKKKVTIQYFDIKLEDALDDMSKSYDINFSYSKNVIPVNQRVSADVSNAPLSIALEDLFNETDVAYVGIGDQIVLKKDPNKRKLLSKGSPKIDKKEEVVLPPPMPKRKKIEEPILISSTDIRAIDFSKKEIEIKYEPKVESTKREMTRREKFLRDLDIASAKVDEIAEIVVDEAEIIVEEVEGQLEEVSDELKNRDIKIGGVTLLGNDKNRVNHVSANLLYGKNGGLNGVEVGVIGNSIVYNVKGVQVAGMINKVGGDMTGTQVSGIINSNKGTTTGLQISGLLNKSGKVKNGIQIAGLGNVAKEDSKNAVQISGLFNVSKGNISNQISLINKAKSAKVQVGLINVADSSNASIGILNFVKNGYNKFEISGSEILYYNTELKLGSKGFYNIFHLGWRNVDSRKGYLAYGYGFGTQIKTRKERFSHNLEIVASQINNASDKVFNFSGDNKLNLLTQLRWTWDFRVGRKTSIFFGPTANVLFSKTVNPDTGEVGLDIAPYSFLNKTITKTVTTTIAPVPPNTVPTTTTEEIKTNIKAWIGFKAGIRF